MILCHVLIIEYHNICSTIKSDITETAITFLTDTVILKVNVFTRVEKIVWNNQGSIFTLSPPPNKILGIFLKWQISDFLENIQKQSQIFHHLRLSNLNLS